LVGDKRGVAGHGMARQGEARHGMARQGEARQGFYFIVKDKKK